MRVHAPTRALARLGDIRPLSEDYHLMRDVFPLKEFTTPALIIPFFMSVSRFSSSVAFDRPVRALDVFEVQFIEPVLPSNFLAVVPLAQVAELAAHEAIKPQVFVFQALKHALVSING